jgi:alpha-ribazole phosphatase
MRLVLLRHPLPESVQGLCYGSSDVAADPAALARALAELPASLPADLAPNTAIYSSPLRRCTALADPLAALLDAAPPKRDARLAEMDFGSWEGQPWDAIARAEVDAWAADLTCYAPGGGETVLAVARRVHGFLDEMVAAHSDAVVVCHAGTIRLLAAFARDRADIEQAALHAAATPHRIGYASITILHF